MLKQVHTSEHLTTYVWPSDVHTYLHHQRPLRGRSTYLLTVRIHTLYLKSLARPASTYLLAKFSAASRPKYILTYVRVRCSASTCCLNMKPWLPQTGRFDASVRAVEFEFREFPAEAEFLNNLRILAQNLGSLVPTQNFENSVEGRILG